MEVGSSMRYFDFVSPKTISEYYKKYSDNSPIGAKVKLENRCWIYEKPHVMLGMIKVMYLEKHYLNINQN